MQDEHFPVVVIPFDDLDDNDLVPFPYVTRARIYDMCTVLITYDPVD